MRLQPRIARGRSSTRLLNALGVGQSRRPGVPNPGAPSITMQSAEPDAADSHETDAIAAGAAPGQPDRTNSVEVIERNDGERDFPGTGSNDFDANEDNRMKFKLSRETEAPR